MILAKKFISRYGIHGGMGAVRSHLMSDKEWTFSRNVRFKQFQRFQMPRKVRLDAYQAPTAPDLSGLSTLGPSGQALGVFRSDGVLISSDGTPIPQNCGGPTPTFGTLVVSGATGICTPYNYTYNLINIDGHWVDEDTEGMVVDMYCDSKKWYVIMPYTTEVTHLVGDNLLGYPTSCAINAHNTCGVQDIVLSIIF